MQDMFANFYQAEQDKYEQKDEDKEIKEK